MSLSSVEKKNFLKFGINQINNGRIEIQIAILTTKINKLQNHFNSNSKDYSGRRGLLNMVAHRRKLLHYLKRKNILIYNSLIQELSLRR
ncbi:30S ribosomal protein S15 [Buchnera aphidicola (Hormaphis cornu)]|nr:30S ribosomal protein S15 [Buchnera aphidicola (Hormaphis cornu)]